MVLSCGERRYILSDASKFGRRALIRVCSFSDIDVLITDQAPPAQIGSVLQDAGVAIETAQRA
jgi:DeoR family glycerol-3-phosphate regulon repressor